MSPYKWEHGRLSKLLQIRGSQYGEASAGALVTVGTHVQETRSFLGGGFCLDHVPKFGRFMDLQSAGKSWTCSPWFRV